MTIRRISDDLSVSPQLVESDLEAIAQRGFRSIICNRPDLEEAGQPDAAEIEAAAARLGLGFRHIPIASTSPDAMAARRMREAIDSLPGPVLAYCRSGNRSAALAEAAAALNDDATRRYDIVIVGGGSAGIACAASLLKRRADLSIAIVEPSDVHYYQPGWTLVGAGVFTPEATRRTMASVMPRRAEWIRAAATAFLPERHAVELSTGETVGYRVLIAAPGLTLDWSAIPGLAEALGQNGVTSNYRYDLAPYTRDLAAGLERGTALFTQPPMPIKCAGAPQKAMYLSCHRWEGAGRLPAIEVEFHNAGPALFGVADYVPALMSYVRRYGIDLHLGSRLVAVDGSSRTAIFERAGKDGPVRSERSFDMLHAVPPQIAPEVVRTGPLADATGFIAVDPVTLRHSVHPDIFALGDAISAGNAKTAAAARKQAPVVAVNAIATLEGRPLEAGYDGYGSCPLTVERGRIVLAEFGYGGKLLPSFPTWMLDGRQPTRRAWLLKDRILPPIYWHGMLKGREWMAHPNVLDDAR